MKFNPLIFKKVGIDEFIDTHTHIRYCEAIIYKDGDISYAVPSHIEALVKVIGEDRDKIREDINKSKMTPIDFLVEKTGCVSVWTHSLIVPKKCTPEQIESIKKLLENSIIIP